MFLNTGLYSRTIHTNVYDGDYRMKLNINDMPSEVNELPKTHPVSSAILYMLFVIPFIAEYLWINQENEVNLIFVPRL